MTTKTEKLQHAEASLHENNNQPANVFAAAHAARDAGNTDKATRYLRMAFNTHETAFMNELQPKMIDPQGDKTRA